MGIALPLHALAAVIWVGGMFFAYMALRPAAGAVLDGPARLRLFAAAFERFFVWVWISVAVLLATGYWMISLLGGMAGVGMHIHAMHGVGLLMMAAFTHIYFAPFRLLKAAVAAEDWESGARNLNSIRMIVGANLVLGLVVVVFGASRGVWS
tara:strand:- start:5329 stop:5784 length:456 start_codon:yes stop_codon:yes gene_type:complete